LKSCCVLQDLYDDERHKTMFHNTTPDLQDQDHSAQDRPICLVSNLSCPKTDSLGPHHWLQSDAFSHQCQVSKLPFNKCHPNRAS